MARVMGTAQIINIMSITLSTELLDFVFCEGILALYKVKINLMADVLHAGVIL